MPIIWVDTDQPSYTYLLSSSLPSIDINDFRTHHLTDGSQLQSDELPSNSWSVIMISNRKHSTRRGQKSIPHSVVHDAARCERLESWSRMGHLSNIRSGHQHSSYASFTRFISNPEFLDMRKVTSPLPHVNNARGLYYLTYVRFIHLISFATPRNPLSFIEMESTPPASPTSGSEDVPFTIPPCESEIRLQSSATSD